MFNFSSPASFANSQRVFSRFGTPLLAAAFLGRALVLSYPAHADVLYVANTSSNTISEYSPSGAYLGSITQALLAPVGLAFDKSGDLFAANLGNYTNGTYPNSYIGEYSPSGAYIGMYANSGTDSEGLAFDKSGNLYVGNLNSISEYSPSGTSLGNFATNGISLAWSLAFDKSGDLYAANLGNNSVSKYSSGGTYLGSLSVSNPTGLAFDTSGNLYVASQNGTISEYSSGGASLGNFATGLSSPGGLAFNTSGDLYVTSVTDNTVNEYSSSGTYLDHITSRQLDYPTGLVFANSPAVPEPAFYQMGALLVMGVLGMLRHRRKRAAADANA